MDWAWINNVIRSVDWSTLASIAVVISAIFIIRQLTEMRRTTLAQAYSTAVGLLLDEKVRLARRTVFQLQGKLLDSWNKEEIDAAEIACLTYDAIGQMVRYQLLAKKPILDSWGASFSSSWQILLPLIQKYRHDFGAADLWHDYEWLASEAKKQDWQPTKVRLRKWLHLSV